MGEDIQPLVLDSLTIIYLLERACKQHILILIYSESSPVPSPFCFLKVLNFQLVF
jgi:hypothetical protein